jgi:hypothetical protein
MRTGSPAAALASATVGPPNLSRSQKRVVEINTHRRLRIFPAPRDFLRAETGSFVATLICEKILHVYGPPRTPQAEGGPSIPQWRGLVPRDCLQLPWLQHPPTNSLAFGKNCWKRPVRTALAVIPSRDDVDLPASQTRNWTSSSVFQPRFELKGKAKVHVRQSRLLKVILNRSSRCRESG